MTKIKSGMIDPKKVIPFERNARILGGAVMAVVESIKAHDFIQPILIDQNFRICIGHTRVEAALHLDLKEIPYLQKHMDEAEFIKLNIADNKTGEIAEWDDEMLRDLILELPELCDGPIEIAGFDDIDEFLHPDPVPGQSKEKKEEEAGPKKFIFAYDLKQYLIIDQKLDAIVRENGLATQADALFFALKRFKGNPKVKRRVKAKTKKKKTKKKTGRKK